MVRFCLARGGAQLVGLQLQTNWALNVTEIARQMLASALKDPLPAQGNDYLRSANDFIELDRYLEQTFKSTYLKIEWVT